MCVGLAMLNMITLARRLGWISVSGLGWLFGSPWKRETVERNVHAVVSSSFVQNLRPALMVDGFLPGMGAAEKVSVPCWTVRTGTAKPPKLETRIDPVTGRPMDTSKPLSKRTGQAMNVAVAAAKPVVVVPKGLKPLSEGADMSQKHGIHGATEPEPSGIWRTEAAATKVIRPTSAAPEARKPAAAMTQPFSAAAARAAAAQVASAAPAAPKPAAVRPTVA